MPDERDIVLREMAQHRGFKLIKSRRRKAGGDFGLYGLTDAATGQDCFGIGKDGLEKSFGEIEEYLRGAAHADWKRSLGAAGEKAKPAKAKKAAEPDLIPEPKPKKAAKPKAAPKPVPRPDPEPQPEPEPEPEPAPPPEPEPAPPPEPEPELVIRDARAADAKSIAVLLATDERDVAATLRQLVQSGQAPLIAEQGEAVGVAAFHVLPLLQQPAPLGRITLLRVAEAHRRRGVGRALVEAVESRLRDRGCEHVEVLSGIDVANAHGFFRRIGYERTAYRFAHDLDQQGSTNI